MRKREQVKKTEVNKAEDVHKRKRHRKVEKKDTEVEKKKERGI